ncbi:Uncharacterised protein [Fusobacterium necrogenes]|uniref:Uncharacterized protein n=1 Tax=Fusobacterium necrogenes TaxID=858 RepID=A0A377GWF8_9FUSO|nr:hypothetical protein [Fusobacterium necrogenes]STO31327.1 Uncharacterised protein [Fusobacterium necrogenes]
MKKIKSLILYIFILLCISSLAYAKGTLKVNAVIQPDGTTKKYSYGEALLLDAGVINSQSGTKELKLATVRVDMLAEPTDVGNPSLPGIEGDFNQAFILNSVIKDQMVKLGVIKKYKNGDNADIELAISGGKIEVEDLFRPGQGGDKYLFVAHESEVEQVISLGYKPIKRLIYTFELWLKVQNAKVGDIVRKDVQAKNNTEAIGNIQDIVKEQFSNARAGI